MAGSVKLDHYESLVEHVVGASIAADYKSPAIDMRPVGHAIVTVKWSGYDGVTGKVYLQLSDDRDATDDLWNNWGSTLAQGTLNTSTGVQVFNIWQSPTTYVRVAVDKGNGTAGTVTITYRFKRG